MVGGGVIGLSIAWELAKKGLSVCILEQSETHHGTSRAGAGILPPANEQTATDPIDQLRALSHRLHQQWSVELHEATGIDNGFRQCGGIYLAYSRGEQASLGGLAQYWEQYQIQAVQVGLNDLNRMEPNLNLHDGLRSGWLLPEEAQIRSPDHLRALRKACVGLGVEILEHTAVTQLIRDGDRITQVATAKNKFPAETVCIAAGAWTSQILSSVGVRPEIFPIRGQVLLYRCQPDTIRHIINEGNRYVVPRADGHLLVGSNEEEVGFEFGTTPDVLDSLKAWAQKVVPLLKDHQPISSWSGLRPHSFDGFPYIGKVPHLRNCFIASGHYRSGLHLSCGTARLLSEMLLGETPCLDPHYFSLAREVHTATEYAHDSVISK